MFNLSQLLVALMCSGIVMMASPSIEAVDTCSRVALINYQEVLVDTNSNQKGEGLRYHLEKDSIAKSYLDSYQSGTEIRWQNTILGTLGTALILSGLLTNSSSDNNQRLIIGGATILSVNYLIARTLENQNESNLIKSIEEYNKRNLPRIYFKQEGSSNRGPSSFGGIMVKKSWRF